MSLQIGRQGQLYPIKEVTQGTTPAIAAGNACRHKSIIFNFDNKNRRTIVEKKQSPWTVAANRTDGRKSGDWKYEGLLRPSGTLNTLPEVDPFLEAALGSKTNVVLNTTVTGGTTTGGTLASAAGLVKWDGVLITCPDGKKRLRFLTTAAVGAIWAPALPAGQAPSNGAAVKGVPTYKLTAGNIITLSLCHYLKKIDATSGLKRAANLAAADDLTLSFDANDDPMLSVGGPCKEVVDPPAQPGGFTMIGSQPPSGITGDLQIGAVALPFLKLSFTLKNGLWLRNDEYGVSAASEAFRKDRAELSVGISCRAEDEPTLYDLTEAGTNVTMFSQTGYVEGNAIAAYCPTVEFKVPGTDDPDDLVIWDFKGMALESADNQNDVFILAIG